MELYKEVHQELMAQTLADGHLLRKEKELILVGINSVLLKEEEAVKHALAAQKEGALVEEVAEILLAAIVTRGLTAWLVGVKALEAMLANTDEPAPKIALEEVAEIKDLADAKTYLAGENGKISNWAALMEDYNEGALLNYTRLRTFLLNDQYISRKVKEYVIIGLNLALGYNTGLSVHIEAAQKEGATKEQIQEVFSVALLYMGSITAAV